MNQIKNIILKFLAAMAVVVLLTSCATKNRVFKTPEKQFVLVRGNINLFACHKEMKICVSAGEGKGYASGVLIAHRKKENKSYYLTAGHACLKEYSSKNNEYVSKVELEIHLFDYMGGDNIAKVVAIDEENDLCLLSTKRVSQIPVVIKEDKLRKNTSVINVAAPSGIWTKDMMFHFTGEYQGERNDQAIFTLTAQPGSSGSPIFDPKTGKLVGMITHVLSPSFDVVFGPTLKQINDFVDKNLPPV